MPRVAIIVLNWNGWTDTIQCIESIHRLSNADYDIILVDNRSSDDSIENIRRYCKETGRAGVPDNTTIYLFELFEDEGGRSEPNLSSYLHQDSCQRMILIKNHENYGYARGNNIGIRFGLNVLKSDYILILNNDVIIGDRMMLNKLLESAESDSSIGAVSPVLRSTNGEVQRTCTRNLPGFLDFIFVYTFIGQRLLKENRIWKSHFNYAYSFDRPAEFDVLGGSCILFRSQAIAEIGLFDENTFLYWEEYIIGCKLAGHGWKSVLRPDAEIIHKGESCIENLNLRSWARYWAIQSELYYIDNYTSLNPIGRFAVIAALLLEAILALVDTIFKGKRSRFDKEYELKMISVLLGSFVKTGRSR